MAKFAERISELKLPREVETKANQIYARLPGAITASKRVNQLVYLTVSEAYKTLNIVFNPKDLASKLKITNMNSMLKDAARLGYEPVRCHYTPEDCLKDRDYQYCRIVGIRTEHMPEIYDIVRTTLEKFPSLNEHTPHSVAAGVIAFYAIVNGYDFNEAEFAAEIGLSHNIVKKVRTIVSRAQ
jgi:hypothetical protein